LASSAQLVGEHAPVADHLGMNVRKLSRYARLLLIERRPAQQAVARFDR
jgi:hypothetical protein